MEKASSYFNNDAFIGFYLPREILDILVVQATEKNISLSQLMRGMLYSEIMVMGDMLIMLDKKLKEDSINDFDFIEGLEGCVKENLDNLDEVIGSLKAYHFEYKKYFDSIKDGREAYFTKQRKSMIDSDDSRNRLNKFFKEGGE